MKHIRRGVHVESQFHGVTVGAIATTSGLVCIDSPTLPEDASTWQHNLVRMEQGPILFVINTDHKEERVLGNRWIDAPAVAHNVTRQLIIKGQGGPKHAENGSATRLKQPSGVSAARGIMPELTFDTKIEICCGESKIRLIHRPGSAPGAIWVWIPEAKVIFVGDSLFTDTHPILAGAQLDDWIESLLILGQSDFRSHTIVPGRSKPTNQASIEFCKNYLRYLRRRLAAWIDQGKQPNEASELAPALLKRFPVAPGKREQIENQLRSGLPHVFETLRQDTEKDRR